MRTFSFILRCRVETCNGKARDCNQLRVNKVSIVGTDMDFMSCYSIKKNFGHSEDMRNMVYGRFVHFKCGSTL